MARILLAILIGAILLLALVAIGQLHSRASCIRGSIPDITTNCGSAQ